MVSPLQFRKRAPRAAQPRWEPDFRPGARQARRLQSLSEYRVRFELCTGHDPWLDNPDFSFNPDALLPEDLKAMGLSVVQLD